MLIWFIFLTIASLCGSVLLFKKRNQVKEAGEEYKKIQTVALGIFTLAIVMVFISLRYWIDNRPTPQNNEEMVEATSTEIKNHSEAPEVISAYSSEELFSDVVKVELSEYCSIGIPSAWNDSEHRNNSYGCIDLYPKGIANPDVCLKVTTIEYPSPFETLMQVFVNEENQLRTVADGGLKEATILTGSTKKIIWEEYIFTRSEGGRSYTSTVVFFPQSSSHALEYTLEMADKQVILQEYGAYSQMLRSLIGTANFQYSYSEQDVIDCLAAVQERKSNVAKSGTDSGISEEKEIASKEPSETSSDKIKGKYSEEIRGHILVNYSGTDIDSITLNENYGTDTEGDYIALVDLTWNVQNKGSLSKEVLKMYSDDLAATVSKECPNIQEIAIFWQVPYLDADAKCSYERKNDAMYEMDMYWDRAFDK